MITEVLSHEVGSLWTVSGPVAGTVVIIAGPFATGRLDTEYLVSPLYTGQEQGFVWTDQDVLIHEHEAGLGAARYVAIWNAGPMLASDLLFQTSHLCQEAIIAVRDAYWASINERSLGKSPRLGRRIRKASDAAALFQARELARWQAYAGRALHAAEKPSSERPELGRLEVTVCGLPAGVIVGGLWKRVLSAGVDTIFEETVPTVLLGDLSSVVFNALTVSSAGALADAVPFYGPGFGTTWQGSINAMPARPRSLSGSYAEAA